MMLILTLREDIGRRHGDRTARQQYAGQARRWKLEVDTRVVIAKFVSFCRTLRTNFAI
ncbi:MAG: hypothetical protein ACK4MF_10890 [Hyphomicrobiaceae bacterium]